MSNVDHSKTESENIMIVQKKIKGVICLTAHPEGCAFHVKQWFDYANQHVDWAQACSNRPKKVLIIGASTSYGLASRVVAMAAGAKTIGVFYERPAQGKRTASAGWYNTVALEKEAQAKGIDAKSINGDAFSDEVKQRVVDQVKADWEGEIDLVIYSIAAPRRTDPATGVTYSSVLKPIGKAFKSRSINLATGRLTEVQLEPATPEEIANTVAVMGGEDWQRWIDVLLENDCLAETAQTVAFSYLGPTLTHPIYRSGTIGRAKENLEHCAAMIDEKLQSQVKGRAIISVNKALVTQASAAIPVVPLYISILKKILLEKGLEEGCIQQMIRLFQDGLYGDTKKCVDSKGRIRLDDREMQADVQKAVEKAWDIVSDDNLSDMADLAGFRRDFEQLFGFSFEGIDYNKEVVVDLAVPSLAVKEEA